MLVENVVQAIARDLLAAALMRLEAAGYPVVLHVHDEVVCEVPEGFGDLKEFKRIIVEAPAWAKGLPIAAKSREGLRFSKEDAPARVAETSTELTEAEAPCAGSGVPWSPRPKPRSRTKPAHVVFMGTTPLEVILIVTTMDMKVASDHGAVVLLSISIGARTENRI
jgi:hypothetical protein